MFRHFSFTLVWLIAVIGSVHADAPKKLLLVGQGPDGHPKQTHEYMAGVEIVAKCLAPLKQIEITTVNADGVWKDGPELIARADAVVLFVSEGAKWIQSDPKRIEALRALAKRGGGLAVLHWGMGCKEVQPIEPFVQLFGGCHGGPDRKYVVAETEISPADAKNPILNGIATFRLKDEFYYRLKFVQADTGFHPLLTADLEGKKETISWAWERPDGGRSFGFSGLHFHENWKRAEYRRLVSHAVLWTLHMAIPERGLPVEISVEELKVK